MRKTTATLLLLAGSTVAYAVNGIVAFLTLRHMGLYEFFFLWSIGGILALPLLLRVLGLKDRPLRGFSPRSPSLYGGILLIVFNVVLFAAFRRYMLAGVYPLIALSSLVFLSTDMAIFRKRLRLATKSALLAGVLLVVAGVYLAESTGYAFNYSILPFIVAIALLAGAGYYLVFYNTRKYGVGPKITSIAVPSFVISVLIAALTGSIRGVPVWYGVGAAFAGFTYITSVALELTAMRKNETHIAAKEVVTRNLINNFTYMDTVLVLLGSIVIASFTAQELVGGLMIVAGVMTMALVRGRQK